MDENRPYTLVFYVKRDAVSTGKLGPTGKIATLAVIAVRRNRGTRHSRNFTRERPGNEFEEIGLDQ